MALTFGFRSPGPFMGICALHCLGCFGLGSNIAPHLGNGLFRNAPRVAFPRSRRAWQRVLPKSLQPSRECCFFSHFTRCRTCIFAEFSTLTRLHVVCLSRPVSPALSITDLHSPQRYSENWLGCFPECYELFVHLGFL